MLEKDKTIILTGGAGFIGSNTALALNQQGFENLIIVDHLNRESKEKRLELVKYEQYYDRGDFFGALPRLKNIAAIVHLGACTDTAMMDEKFMMENNKGYSMSAPARLVLFWIWATQYLPPSAESRASFFSICRGRLKANISPLPRRI